MTHLVRVGAIGHIGRFSAADGLCCARGERVLVRTSRGLECGEVLAAEPPSAVANQGDGPLLRRLTDQDAMLAERLERNREAAYSACVSLLQERGSASVLLEVEHLFDGQGLYFYFLGEPDQVASAISAELAEAYDSQAKFAQFADTLTAGCGPGCGTAEAVNGCGTAGGCATCSIASACAKG